MNNSPLTRTTPKPLSWRLNLLWTSGGTVLYAACNWAMLSAIAKLGTTEMVGEFALALALSFPVLMLAQMNLRAVLATDARGEHRFRDYRALRIAATVLGVLIIAAIGAFGYLPRVAWLIVLVAMGQGVEGISDIYYGLMQQHERMDRITVSNALRGPLGLLAMAGTLWATGSLIAASAALLLARTLVLVFYDAGRGSRDFEAAEPPMAGTWRDALGRQWTIFRVALPLSTVMLLCSLCTNMPRYFIEHHLGTRELGIFSAAASLVAVGNTLINAVGQTVTPKLAKLYAFESPAAFGGFTLRLLMFGAGLGAAAVLCALLLGRWVLALMFRPEYAAHAGLLTMLMVAGGIGYVASLLGFAVTAARSFRPQLPLFAVVAAATLIACAVAIPSYGLRGAALAVGISAAVQCGGLALLLFRVLATRNQSLPLAIPELEPNA